MTQLLMDENNDLAIVENKFVLTENLSDLEISQKLIQRLRLFLNEWFLDTTRGLPYFQAILVKGTPASVIKSAFIDEIIGTAGVVSINSFDDLDLDSGTRVLKVKFDVTTINGNNLTIDEVIL